METLLQSTYQNTFLSKKFQFLRLFKHVFQLAHIFDSFLKWAEYPSSRTGAKSFRVIWEMLTKITPKTWKQINQKMLCYFWGFEDEIFGILHFYRVWKRIVRFLADIIFWVKRKKTDRILTIFFYSHLLVLKWNISLVSCVCDDLENPFRYGFYLFTLLNSSFVLVSGDSASKRHTRKECDRMVFRKVKETLFVSVAILIGIIQK